MADLQTGSSKCSNVLTGGGLWQLTTEKGRVFILSNQRATFVMDSFMLYSLRNAE